jgi:hypothetical protein
MQRREFLLRTTALGTAVCSSATGLFGQDRDAKATSERNATGPLRVSAENPRYFADGSGRIVYLTGSHVWNNLVDMGQGDPPPSFDYDTYLEYLARYGHNFIRLWTWEHFAWDSRANGRWGKETPHVVVPQPWARTGPGNAADGKLRFDLTKFDDDYFKRLRSRVEEAGRRGVYVSVMLFEGWAMQRIEGAWLSHPFHSNNNVNGIDGDANGDGKGLEVHTLTDRAVTERQEAYVRMVIETVGDLDNVLYEISNENHPASTEWQYHMIDFVHAVERERPKQHPVGMTFQYQGGSNQTLFDGPAEWISPNPDGGYRDDPPAADGKKVILTDTDHLWGIGGNAQWAWKSFLRGMNPIFMDPYDGVVLGDRFSHEWEPIRVAMGMTRKLAERINLAECVPHGDLASTKYCLAEPGREYLVYLPDGDDITLDLSAARGPLMVEWINAETGRSRRTGDVEGGSRHDFGGPDGESVLHVRRV